MRRLLTIAVLAVAAFAVAVPSASGARYDPNPDFPHGDMNGENWVDALIVDEAGTFEFSNTEHWNFAHKSFGQWQYENSGATCASPGAISGEIVGNQAFVTQATMFEPICYGGRDLPWEGNICQHAPSGDVWLRLDMSVARQGAAGLAGEVFLKVDLMASEISASWALLNHDLYFPTTAVTETRLDAEFEIDGVTENAAVIDLGPCGWPELQG